MINNPVSVNYVSEGTHGHRVDYDRVLIAEMKALNIHLERMEKARHAIDPRRPFFYSMLDSHVLAFLSNAVMRSLRGRCTVGLFFRPGACFTSNSLKYRIKQKLFLAVSRLPNVHILTLLPFAVSPRYSEVATAWIYDPQLWDLLQFGFSEDIEIPALRHLLDGQARGRRILIALGEQSGEKGFDYLVDVWCSSEELRQSFLFVAAGNIARESMQKADRFVQQGGLLINRRISNEELMYMYRIAEIIWSCYSPAYDQASGIFGRAVQFGVPVTVRKDSCLERLGGTLMHPTLPLPFGGAHIAAKDLLAWKPVAPAPADRLGLINEMHAHSVSVLADYFRSHRVL